ncbi:ie-0 [Artaxa digramma nucleopolyhedrovirus]|uniref:Ie-0 n=1 Tax=Artaxa digramma nucleopolyhedrovirus TaxID=3070910 RepID=A0AAE6R696_9ABAC|nr:ie-0 [Euproctis digramma nucleopolyhedrovirus]QHB21673.1 ie-0 [Artaxa digramma nucleopolyhedrovirus]
MQDSKTETTTATEILMIQMNGGSVVNSTMAYEQYDRLERAQVIVNNFVLLNYAYKNDDRDNNNKVVNQNQDENLDVRLNIAKQSNIKMEAFNLVDRYYKRAYDAPIDKHLRMREFENEIVISKDDVCVHYLIAQIHAVVNVIKTMCEGSVFKHNSFIFLPYCRQLKAILNYFVNDYCCASSIKSSIKMLDDLIGESLMCLDAIKLLNDCVQIMMVFSDEKLPVYECNICGNVSNEKCFLKPDECCGYKICGMCYAQLWQHCNLYPVCPVCKTSFNSVSELKANKTKI